MKIGPVVWIVGWCHVLALLELINISKCFCTLSVPDVELIWPFTSDFFRKQSFHFSDFSNDSLNL